MWDHPVGVVSGFVVGTLHYRGENLAMTTAKTFDTSDLTGFTQSWYNEVVDTEWADDGVLKSKVYADPENECQSWDAVNDNCMIDHYTQVVWAKSTKVGCGVASCDTGLFGSGGVMLVCKYSPPGNLAGNHLGLSPYFSIDPLYIDHARCQFAPSVGKGKCCSFPHEGSAEGGWVFSFGATVAFLTKGGSTLRCHSTLSSFMGRC
jgi:hypothetical protein